MFLEENQIAFHSEDGLIHDSVKDYSRQLAEMIGLGGDNELPQAGVSLPFIITNEFFSLGTITFDKAGFWEKWFCVYCIVKSH